MIYPLVVLLFALTSPAAADVYRCTESGHTVYADKPCGANTKSLAIQAGIPESEAIKARLQSQALTGHVALGQSPAQVELAWGEPKTRNVDVGSSGRTEQWVYERPEGTSYVYFRGGVVSSFNTRFENGKAPPPAPPAAAPRPPTKAELEAQERTEKAAERKFIHEGDSRAKVRSNVGEPHAKNWSGDIEYWTYEPASKDYQTQTVVRFNLYGGVFAVDRTIKR